MVSPVSGIPPVSQVPLPDFQSDAATRDPLPIDSTPAVQQATDKLAEKAQQTQDDAFEDYLNQTGTLTANKPSPSSAFDPIAELEKQSIYIQPGLQQGI